MCLCFAGIQKLSCTVWNEEKADRSAAPACSQGRQTISGSSSGQTGMGSAVCPGNYSAFFIAKLIGCKVYTLCKQINNTFYLFGNLVNIPNWKLSMAIIWNFVRLIKIFVTFIFPKFIYIQFWCAFLNPFINSHEFP